MLTFFQSAPLPPAQEPAGFFTDTTLCIGCKACEIACKQWNQLPADGQNWRATSYDNTHALSASTWRHVAFIESGGGEGARESLRWLMASDVCKHCQIAPCEEACPTGAIIYNEFHNVYVQQDICNGCGYCVAACPFGVLDRAESDGRAHKCTLCYDRQRDGMEPACAQACPTDSIRFGPVSEMKRLAETRVAQLRARGDAAAYLYGTEPAGEYSALNAFFLLNAPAPIYNLPEAPRRPAKHLPANYGWSALMALALSALAAWTVRRALSPALARGQRGAEEREPDTGRAA